MCLTSTLIYSNSPIELASDFFKYGEYDKAIEALSNIESIKESEKDDTLYLLGKINAKKQDTDKAITYFNRVITEYPKSSKAKLSYLNLARLYNLNNEWNSTIQLLVKIENIYEESSNNNKLLSILSYAYYRSAIKSKGLEKVNKLQTSAKYYETVIPRTDKTKDKISLAKIYGHLYKIYPSKLEYKDAGFAIIKELEKDESIKSSRIEYIKGLYVIKQRKNDLDIQLDLFGAYWKTPGIFGELNIENSIPINNNTFKLGLSSKYNPYTYKSFNFLKSKDLDNRYLQWTFDNKAYIKYASGDKDGIYNSLRLESTYRTAEDEEDNSVGVSLSDNFSIKPNTLLKIKLYSSFGGKIFPNYLVNSNKIDYLIGKVKPVIEFNLIDTLSIGLEHKFTYKGYTQATYADPDNNRYYLINRPGIKFNYDEEIFDISVLAGYEILNSYNYDYTVSTPLNTSTFDNYEDYTSPFVKVSVQLKPVKKLKIMGNFSFSKTDYVNKYARDESNIYTGDKRSDTDIEVKAEVSYKLNKVLSIISSYNYFNKTSNMKYENSFITNADYQTIFAGISLKI